MTIIFKDNDCVLLDHREFSINIYKRVSEYGHKDENSYKLKKSLFSIQNSEKKVNRKRSHNSNEFQDETIKVRQMYETFLTKLPTELKTYLHTKYSLLATSAVRDHAQKLFESTLFDHTGISGGNDSDVPLKCKVGEENFLIPEKARFFCGCVIDQCKKLAGSRFDVLIADPPWWNKYIRRLKGANDKLSYSMMYNEDIASIPVKDILSANCLVAVWCTNAPSNIDAVKNMIFPNWGITYITTWYWLKVTVDLQPLCPFGVGCNKQPYERLMLGTNGDLKIPQTQLVVSVPSALHSHKAPLLDVLKPYVETENPQILELFARYLLPNTTSVGFEPLKWQHISLYENVT